VDKNNNSIQLILKNGYFFISSKFPVRLKPDLRSFQEVKISVPSGLSISVALK
jgi:hypothetical protein